MSTDTTDASAKPPSKGFSLRSRLLGIPPEEKPQPETDADNTQQDALPATRSEDDAGSADAAAGPVDVRESLPSADETEDGEEPPRVGVAVTPKRSLLSMAFGIGERKVQNDAEAGTSPLSDPTPLATQQTSLDDAVSLTGGSEDAASLEHEETHQSAQYDEPAATPDESMQQENLAAPEPSSHERGDEVVPGRLPFVRFSEVVKTYDGVNLVVKGLNLDIAKGEFLTLLGPSGSGKTTTLMMLAGFETPTSGDILLNGTSINDVPPHKRGLGFVFQNYALFPHMTVQENVAFPLEVRGMRGAEIRDRVAKALGMVELSAFGKRKPHQLSGGQQQRVAMARALVFDPEIVLMDEPLGALDKNLREQMQYELKRLHRELGVTVVYVTHDQSEALTLSDRIAVFHDGIIQQLDTPVRVYDEPANAFVAGFIGENNALPGKIIGVSDGICTLELIGGARVRALNGNCDVAGQAGVICVRPEHLSISPETLPGGNHVAALIEDFIFHGDHVRVKLSAPGMSEIFVKTPARGVNLPSKGVAVTLSWDPVSARAFVS